MSLKVGMTTTNFIKTLRIRIEGQGQRILQIIILNISVGVIRVPKARTSRKQLMIDISFIRFLLRSVEKSHQRSCYIEKKSTRISDFCQLAGMNFAGPRDVSVEFKYVVSL